MNKYYQVGENRGKKYFINFFRWGKKKVKVRPGAMQPEQVKELVKKIGKNKKVNIRRVEFDGTPEVDPVSVRIIDIRDDYFTGEIINVERSIKQELDDRVVYVKGGGGTIDFYYDDGDILSIEEDIDEEIVQERNVEEILQILDALDLDEPVLISYYDNRKGGVINGAGKLVEKDVNAQTFSVELYRVNDIELDKPMKVSLDLKKDAVLDLEVQL